MGDIAWQDLAPEDREWLHGHLQARLGTILGPEAERAEATLRLEQTLDEVLAEFLARRAAEAPGPAPARRGWAFEPDPRRRVVVTGLGVISAVGQSVPDYWDGLVNGRSGISYLDNFDTTPYPTKFAGQIKHWDPAPWIDPHDAKRMSRATQFLVAAARQAVRDAALPLPPEGRDDMGVLIGCGTTSIPDTENEMKVMFTRGGRRISPFFIPMALPNMPAGQLGIQFGARGWNASITTACAASTTAIGEGAQLIRRGATKIMLVGGTEAPLSEFGLASFVALRALSTRSDDPAHACRPWDITRDGMVGGEGAGILVLERLDYALARGARIYAEIVGSGGSCDAYHIVAPDPTGRGGALALRAALDTAGLEPGAVDYINAHGTGTDLNDPMETRAIKQVFGDAAYRVAISSIKSMTGHLLSGCGAIEGVATVMALHDGIVPPTMNLRTPDPVCDLDYTPNEARRADLRVAVSENFGFGGQNAAVVFRRWDGE